MNLRSPPGDASPSREITTTTHEHTKDHVRPFKRRKTARPSSIITLFFFVWCALASKRPLYLCGDRTKGEETHALANESYGVQEVHMTMTLILWESSWSVDKYWFAQHCCGAPQSVPGPTIWKKFVTHLLVLFVSFHFCT